MTNSDDNNNNIKRITEWEVLTPTGWQDFDGVKKTTKSSSLTISFMDPENIEQSIICSKGHQLFIKRYDEQMYMFAEMIDAETDSILHGDNKTFCAITGIKENVGEVELYDLINVRNGYEYITNGVVSHNCAHVEGIDELWLGLQPTLSTGGSAILISSPAGVGNLFHRIWVDAKTDPNKNKEGKNGFFPIELPWTVHPERDQNWFNAQRAEIITATGERGVGMELLCLDGDSMISIENNGAKKIKNIKVGDLVLTHKGQYKSVTKLYKHKLKENENLYEATVPGTSHKMLITGNHPILNYSFAVPKGKNKIAYLREAIKNNSVSLSFNSIGELDYYKNITNTNGRKVTFGCLYPDDIDNIDLIKLERHSIGELEWQAIPNTDYNSELAPYVYNIEVEDDHSYVANGFIVHNCNFASSGDTFIKGEALDDLMNATRAPEHIQAHGRDEAWIWESPNPNSKYIISADVSRGDAEDYSTFVIIDTNENEVVADFKGKLPPDKFADLLIEYGQTYNNALICQELNSVGVACAIKLKSHKYKNLFYEKFQKNMYMSYVTQEVEDEFPGFTMSQNVRTEILAKLETTIRNKKIKLYSKRLFEELQTFIWKNNKPQAQKGYNDDLSMALAIGCSLYEPDGTSTSNNADDAWALLKGMSRESKTINPFTGDQKTHNKQTIATSTADGMFKLKSKGPTQGMPPGRITGANSGLHHYTDAQWQLVKWMYEE